MDMKRVVVLSFVALLFMGLFSCGGPKPYYKTSVGKKKLKYYNDIQFGRNQNPKKKF
jgi:ABC-type oligopeptide transport system substrate-binding subunit